MRAAGLRADRWPAQDQVACRVAKQVRQVRGPAGELPHLRGAGHDLGVLGAGRLAEPRRDGVDVEGVLVAQGDRLVAHSGRVQGVQPGGLTAQLLVVRRPVGQLQRVRRPGGLVGQDQLLAPVDAVEDRRRDVVRTSGADATSCAITAPSSVSRPRIEEIRSVRKYDGHTTLAVTP